MEPQITGNVIIFSDADHGDTSDPNNGKHFMSLVLSEYKSKVKVAFVLRKFMNTTPALILDMLKNEWDLGIIPVKLANKIISLIGDNATIKIQNHYIRNFGHLFQLNLQFSPDLH